MRICYLRFDFLCCYYDFVRKICITLDSLWLSNLISVFSFLLKSHSLVFPLVPLSLLRIHDMEIWDFLLIPSYILVCDLGTIWAYFHYLYTLDHIWFILGTLIFDDLILHVLLCTFSSTTLLLHAWRCAYRLRLPL